MSTSRTPSTGSGSGTTRSVGKSSIGSSSVGSILSRVLGSFRHLPRDATTANSRREDAAAAAVVVSRANNAFKITHRPDRPRHDGREDLRHRNSGYVLAQLRRIWKHSEDEKKMAEEEAKRRERERDREAWAGARDQSSSRADDGRDRDPRTRSSKKGGDDDDGTGRRSRPRAPTLQTADLMPNFSRKASSPEIARSRWRTDGRLVYSPSSPATSSDQMTIRVGMVQSPYGGDDELDGLKMAPGRAGDGGYYDTSVSSAVAAASRPPPGSFTSAVLPTSVPSFPPSARNREVARGQQTRSGRDWSRADNNTVAAHPHPANAMQASTSARGRTPLYLNNANQDKDSTPSLVQNYSSPASGAASPLTPTDPLFDDDNDHDAIPPTKKQHVASSKKTYCPLCGGALQTATDQSHNLCTACRRELQPRQSIFTSDVINPSPRSFRPLPSARARANPPRLSLFPSTTTGHGPTARAGARDGTRVRDAMPPPPPSSASPTKKKKMMMMMTKKPSDAELVSSRFNRDRSEFKLQPVPLSRKQAQREPGTQLGDPSPSPSAAPAEHQQQQDRGGANHIGYQLAGWPPAPSLPLPAPSSAPQARQPPPPPSAESRPRVPSGPLLEPRTFRPTMPSTRRKGNATISIPVPRRSGSRARLKGRGAGGGGGQAQQHHRAHGAHAHGERTGGGIRKGNNTNNNTPRSPGQQHGRNRHHHHHHQQQPQPQSQPHAERRVPGQGASIPGGEATTVKGDAAAAAATAAVPENIDRKPSQRAAAGGTLPDENEDIYREIDNIIDSYLRRPDMSEPENEGRKAGAVASYFAEVPIEVEMRLKGFF
ncbi:hypothetical protein F5Y14DRAFT_377275 [Nemania sp. NC0429]|nr:hypothetical protein F5Y14DRAFT_377275 [Nemania sp. NC0429]